MCYIFLVILKAGDPSQQLVICQKNELQLLPQARQHFVCCKIKHTKLHVCLHVCLMFYDTLLKPKEQNLMFNNLFISTFKFKAMHLFYDFMFVFLKLYNF